MSFNHRPAVKPATSSTLVVDSFSTDEKTGVVSRLLIPAEGPLPSMDVYNYDKMIKAGVDLHQVNTSILSSVNIPEVPEEKLEEKLAEKPVENV